MHRNIRSIAAAACVVSLLAAPAQALTVRYTAPSFGNAGADCRDVVLVPLAPTTALVCFAELRSLLGLMWRDSTTANPGSAIAFVRPTPIEPGSYTLRAWTRVVGVIPAGCDTSLTFQVLAPTLPSTPRGLNVR